MELTIIFKRLFVWMGIPQITIDQVMGYEEVVCLCKDPRCQKIRARLSAEFHIVKNPNGEFAAEPIKGRIHAP